jgi:2-oxoglutarate-dependent dioxygenase
MALTRDQIEQFHRDGYLPVGAVVTDDELAEARAAYDRIFGATEKPSTYRDLGERADGRSEGAVLQIIDMWKLDDIFKRLIHKAETIDMVEALLGTSDILLYHDQALFKPALHGDEVPWHQDNGYWKFDPPNAISLWMALDDADEANGCMRFVPGSQKAGEAGHQRAGQYIAQLKTDADESMAVPVPLPAGAALFHHCQTLHNTQPNRSTRQRRAWVRHYIAADVTQGGKLLTDRPVLRGATFG